MRIYWLCLFTLLSVGTNAFTAVLYDGFGPDDSYDRSHVTGSWGLYNMAYNPRFASYRAMAASFVVPESAFFLTSVDAAMWTDAESVGVSMSIATDDHGHPGNILEPASARVGSDGIYSFKFSGTTLLNPATYWIVATADYSADKYLMAYWNPNDQQVPGLWVKLGPGREWFRDGNATPAFRVRGTIETLKVPQLSWLNPADITYGTALGEGQLNAVASVPGSFSYVPKAEIMLSAGDRQLLSVTFTPTDENYASVTTSVSINVLQAAPSISWTNPADITYGTLLGVGQLNATSSVPGSWLYIPADGILLESGLGQALTATLTPDNTNYTAATASVRLNVLQATPLITWTNPADIAYGAALGNGQLNATASVPGSFLYTPGEGTVPSAGAEQVLSVAFSPTDTNYTTATNTVRLNVLQATPLITWTNPADITYGTALGEGQLNATANVPGRFNYAPPAGTVLSAGGGQTLAATFTPDDANHTPATNTVRLNVLQATPSITWTSPADITYGTALGESQLNATANVPGRFNYAPPAGTVLSAGGGQTLAVTFTPDDGNHTPATNTVRLNVLQATPFITWTNPADITYGTALGEGQLNATANVTGRFVYAPPAGTVLSAGAGWTLAATFTPDDANHTPATNTVRINVLQATPSITWTNPADITYGTALGEGQLNATANVPGRFVYAPPAGTVLSAGAGWTLAATFTPDDANHTPATNTVRINVLQAVPLITWNNPVDITYGTALGESQLNATANVPGRFVYAPPAGTVLSAGAGWTLAATFTPDDANHTPATNTVRINVLQAVPLITWNNPVDITYGTALGESQLNATANVPGRFVYAPPAGTVLSAGGGQTLAATFTPDDANHTPATNTVRLNVLQATPSITWTSPADITYGTALGESQLNATANVPGRFNYAPPAGTVLSAGGGQTLAVTFTPDDANHTPATNTVRLNVLQATPSITWTSPADITYGTALGESQLNATANVPGRFVYAPPAGTVVSAGAGWTLAATFTPDDANHTPTTNSVRINVLQATPLITWTNPADITYGTALGEGQLNATANVAGRFVYAPPAGTVLPAGAGQTLAATFTPDDANLTPATNSVRINVLQATPLITWTNPVDIIYGTALGEGQLNATANVPGRFIYAPPVGTVLSAGAGQTLAVTFTPDDANHTPATNTVRLNVLQATPSITWTNPADIAYGAALGNGQLNAIASVPGSFLYTPGEGTVPSAGAEQVLSVAFSPTDTNYTTATNTVRINVLQATPLITWTNPVDIIYGTALGEGQLNATASVAGRFDYAPPAGTVLSAGVGQTLAVTFTPDDANHTPATNTVRLNVLQATPLITWTNPSDVTYGTALGEGQLNATANVVGRFVYAPPAGTVLSAGAGWTLAVTFTPDDANHTPATNSVRLNVLIPPASLRGVATDALTKAPLAGVLVRLGNRTQTTGPAGGFVFTNLTPGGLAASFTADPDSGPAPLAVRFQNASVDGAYTLQAESPGYSVYSYAPLVLAMGEDKQWNFSLSPSLRGLRLVLNWGANPKDLDAHLLTPRIDGVRYHIQYQNRYFGQTNRPPFAQLDADETSGYGPETITIASNAPGIYRYYAHNYQEDQGNTGAFTNSEAVVQIYSTAGLIQTVRVPAVGVGDYWEVCAIDGASGQITVINQIVTREPQPDDSVTIPTGDDPGSDTNKPPQWLWSFGDGLSSDQENPTHVYLAEGVYPVSLQITLPDGRISTSSRPGLITVTGSADGRPRLAIARAGTDVLIRWPATDTGYRLESRSDLSTGAWTLAPQLPQAGPGNTNTARIPMSGQQYFRLRK